MSNDSSDAHSNAMHIEVRIDAVVTLQELCSVCNTTSEFVGELVAFGALEPLQGSGPHDWRFHDVAVQRSRIAVKLQQNLEVNTAGAALILDLLDELREARARMHLLEQLSDS